MTTVNAYFVFSGSLLIKDKMKNFVSVFLAAITMALLAGFEQAGAATVDILVHDQVVSKSPVIRLGDIARIVTADRQRSRQLSALLLMPAPAPGTQRFLRKREVEDLLAAHGEDLSQLRIDGATQVAIKTPTTATVSEARATAERVDTEPMNRHAAILAGYEEPVGKPRAAAASNQNVRDEIRRAISSYIDVKTGQTGGWRVTCDVPARHLAQLDLATSPPTCSGGSAPWTGRQQLVISFQTTKGAMQFPICADVAPAIAPVVVAVQPIAGGAVITASDVELQMLESAPVAMSRRAPVTSIEELIGMEARQPIAAGDVIFTDKVQAPVLVKRGEIITVVSQVGSIRVTTEARARQNGSRGELVRLESLGTRETYDARVTGLREAAVFAARSMAVSDNSYSPKVVPSPPAPPNSNQTKTVRRLTPASQ